jgi:hypothetical protein
LNTPDNEGSKKQLVEAGLETLQGILQAGSWRIVGLRLGTLLLLCSAGYIGWLLWDLRPAIETRLRQAPEIPTLDDAYNKHRDQINGLLLTAVQTQGNRLRALQLLAPYKGRSGIVLWEQEIDPYRTPLTPGQPFSFGIGAAEQLGDSMLGLCGERQETTGTLSILCAVRGPAGKIRGWIRAELNSNKPLSPESLLDWWSLAESVSDTAWPRCCFAQ